MSQRLTFPHSPRLGIRSSRLNAWSVCLVIQSRRFAKPPEPDKVSKPPPSHAGGYNFVYSRMCGRAHQSKPIKGGTLASAVSHVPGSWVVNNSGPSWDFCPGLLHLVCSPLRRWKLLSSYWSSFSTWGARRSTIDRCHLNQAAALYQFRHNHLSQLTTNLGAPSIVSITK